MNKKVNAHFSSFYFDMIIFPNIHMQSTGAMRNFPIYLYIYYYHRVVFIFSIQCVRKTKAFQTRWKPEVCGSVHISPGTCVSLDKHWAESRKSLAKKPQFVLDSKKWWEISWSFIFVLFSFENFEIHGINNRIWFAHAKGRVNRMSV